MKALGSVSDNADFLAKQFGWMGDIAGGLGYFLGGDFAKALAKGFMA